MLGTDLVTDLYQNVSPAYAVHRIGGDGLRPAGWPVQGLSFAPPWGFSNTVDAGEFASLRALPDGRGGAFLGVPGFGSEATSLMQFVRFAADGGTLPGGVSLDTRGIEAASRGDGGMFAASYFPSGPTNIYTPNAYVSVQQTVPGSGYYEYSAQPVATRYGDIGLTATDDGGAIFVWSQYIDRQGVFAVRLGPAGVVTGVTPPTAPVGPPSLKLRFVPGVGVRALVASVPSAREELWLHDSSGRLVASARIESASGGDWVFPGTERLRSGMYFARAVSAGVVLNARIAVIR